MSHVDDCKTKISIAPVGLRSLIEKCLEIYPNQTNPLQVTTVVKYWLGGQDPLDYISMYYNEGDKLKNIPPHWHYISFGLSDLHGDGRVHVVENIDDNVDEKKSGMGFELTFRLLKKGDDEDNNSRPPTWPANLLQALARYCFQTGNRFFAGDNVPWCKALDGSNSKLQHILIAEDAQLKRTETPFGWVDFYQIVGVTEEELEQASRWNGKGILNLLKRDNSTGGNWLITDMNREQSVFQLFPETLTQLQEDLEKDGSDLAGVNAEFRIREIFKIEPNFDTDTITEQCADDEVHDKKYNSNFLETMSSNDKSLQDFYPVSCGTSKVLPLDGLEITMAPYTMKFLLLAIKDRVRHGRHFTFKEQSLALTFLSESVVGAVVTKENPYGIFGFWIQVMITDDLIPRMIETFMNALSSDSDTNHKKQVFEWPDKKLKIIIDGSDFVNNSKLFKESIFNRLI